MIRSALINERTADSDGGFLAPFLRAWAEQQARHDGSKRLATVPADSLLAPFASTRLCSRATVISGRLMNPAAINEGSANTCRMLLR